MKLIPDSLAIACGISNVFYTSDTHMYIYTVKCTKYIHTIIGALKYQHNVWDNIPKPNIGLHCVYRLSLNSN